VEKTSEERNVDSRCQVQLKKDGGSTSQSWMKTSGLWPLLGALSNKLDEDKWSVATAGSTEQQGR